jgi:hypothetical protein
MSAALGVGSKLAVTRASVLQTLRNHRSFPVSGETAQKPLEQKP